MTVQKFFNASRADRRTFKPYGLALIASAVIGASMAWTALPALAQSGPMGQMGHMGHHGRSPGGAEGWWGANPERIERMLSAVNASQAQRDQIQQILKNSASERSAQREAGRTLREQAMAVFTAPVVDADAAEKVRQQMLAQHDQASRRMMTTMLAVSNVLTAEQRAQLAAHMQKRGRSKESPHAM